MVYSCKTWSALKATNRCASQWSLFRTIAEAFWVCCLMYTPGWVRLRLLGGFWWLTAARWHIYLVAGPLRIGRQFAIRWRSHGRSVCGRSSTCSIGPYAKHSTRRTFWPPAESSLMPRTSLSTSRAWLQWMALNARRFMVMLNVVSQVTGGNCTWPKCAYSFSQI